MNRLQTKIAIILLSRSLFINPNDQTKISFNEAKNHVKIIYEEESLYWINVSFFK